MIYRGNPSPHHSLTVDNMCCLKFSNGTEISWRILPNHRANSALTGYLNVLSRTQSQSSKDGTELSDTDAAEEPSSGLGAS